MSKKLLIKFGFRSFMKSKAFSCIDKDNRCGKIRIIKFDTDSLEICFMPEKRPIKDIQCIVVKTKDIIKFINLPQRLSLSIQEKSFDFIKERKPNFISNFLLIFFSPLYSTTIISSVKDNIKIIIANINTANIIMFLDSFF